MTVLRPLSVAAYRTCSLSIALGIIAATIGCRDANLHGGGPLPHPASTTPPVSESPCQQPTQLPVIINEVMIHNVTTIADQNGDFGPWIELYNATANSIDLGAATLSDDFFESDKWSFPCETSIQPGEYLIVWIDGQGEAAGPLHTSFTIDAIEDLQLVLNGASDIVEFDGSGLIDNDRSAGTVSGVDGFYVLATPTPGAPNSGSLNPIEIGFVRGDADGNGVVDAADLGLLQTMILERADLPACADVLDVNDDGELNVADIDRLAHAIAGVGPTLPLPYPAPGLDLTPDDLSCFAEGDTP